MAQSKTMLIRISPELIERLDRHVERLQGRHPGLTLSRSSLVRQLIIDGLDQAEGVAPSKPKPPPSKRPPKAKAPRRRPPRGMAKGEYRARVLETDGADELEGREFTLHETSSGWRWKDGGGQWVSIEASTLEQAIAHLMNDHDLAQIELTDPAGEREVWNPDRAAEALWARGTKPAKRRRRKK